MSVTQTPTTGPRWPAIITMWIGLIITAVETLLGIRFVLRLVGANHENGFTNFIYDITAPLIQPFQGIVDPQTVGDDGVLEPETLIALVVYLLLALFVMAGVRTIGASAPRPKASAWQTRAADVYVRLSSLHDSLATSAEASRPGFKSREAEADLEQLAQSLHSLELSPPSARAGAIVRHVIDALNGVRTALESPATGGVPPSTGPPALGSGPEQGRVEPDSRAVLQGQLAVLEAALLQFRALA